MEQPNNEERAVAHEVRQRVFRPATPEETERHGQIREKIEEELPELKSWRARRQRITPAGSPSAPSSGKKKPTSSAQSIITQPAMPWPVVAP